MKYALSISAALLLLAVGQPAPAQAQSPRELVNQAIAAEGGIDALRGLKALAIKADAMHWEPGQSKTADGEPRMLGNTTLTITWDLANGMARTQWDRDMKYPAVEKIKYTDVVTPTLGYVIDDKGASKPMSGIRVAATLRELERASPTLLLMLRADCGQPETRSSAARPCAPSALSTGGRTSPFCSTRKASFPPPSARAMTTISRAIRSMISFRAIGERSAGSRSLRRSPISSTG